MGGNAFNTLMGKSIAFPRMRPEVYTRLKTHLTERLKSPYRLVGVPIEAPEKEDYGDVDFIVCGPPFSSSNTFDRVKECLGARHAFLHEKGHLGHFAIPAGDELGPPDSETYFQIDVHVCVDEAEWNRVLFLNSYGDLGMILGLVARANGFIFGMNGLKTYFEEEDDYHISAFLLSDSVHQILSFFGLSMEEWERGFPTVSSIFSWVQTSRFFDPQRLIVANPIEAQRAIRKQRTMYTSFLELSHKISAEETESRSYGAANTVQNRSTYDAQGFASHNETNNIRTRTHTDAELLEEALVYFDRKEKYDALVAKKIRRRKLREQCELRSSGSISQTTGRTDEIVHKQRW